MIQLLGHHDYVCTRHRIWIGPPDLPDRPQPALPQLPEVVAAQHAHRRLLRRFGPAATYDAVLTGFLICGRRWDTIADSSREPGPDDAWHHWKRRGNLLIPPGTEAATFSASRLFAAVYPEAVHIAAYSPPGTGADAPQADLRISERVLELALGTPRPPLPLRSAAGCRCRANGFRWTTARGRAGCR